ncbi:MAG: YfhL family 4Fe-4S dicluster ferredoxin [Polyangiaceae bacterium]|jgi:ferredoxin|nr:YfhL family 4Fe-4S dicluster ferredoxin [Polyangiaceae bacterium]
MALHITSDCIECCACEPECPNDAIRVDRHVFVIDPDRCTECVGFHEQAACQRVCPVECCLPDPAHPETEEQLIRKAVRLHPDDIALAARTKANVFPSRYRSEHER